MKNAVASSTFNDIWAGETPVWLVPFKTKRGGQTVTRYRWESGKAVHCGFASSGFATPEQGMAAANRHALMSPVQIVNELVFA